MPQIALKRIPLVQGAMEMRHDVVALGCRHHRKRIVGLL
jgi:hypothetical protein